MMRRANLTCQSSSFGINGPGFLNLPAYLSSIKHQNPWDKSKGNWQHLKGNDKDVFHSFATNPSASEDFNNVMMTYAAAKMGWVETYPTE